MAQEGLILTEDQVRALEKAQQEKQAHGEIETEHRVYLGAQDTYYLGNLKGVGRIYQQTFIDSYSQGSADQAVRPQARNCRRRHAQRPGAALLRGPGRAAAENPDRSRQRVLRQSREPRVRVVPGLGENIEHTRTRAKSPQTNGICESFHQAIQNEFYASAFRRKLYHSLEELQLDADGWMSRCNSERVHSGKYCYGKTPMQTFIESATLAHDKQLDRMRQPSSETAAVAA